MAGGARALGFPPHHRSSFKREINDGADFGNVRAPLSYSTFLECYSLVCNTLLKRFEKKDLI